MRTFTARLFLFMFLVACSSSAWAQGPQGGGAKKDTLPEMFIAVPSLVGGQVMPPFVTDSVKRGRVKDIDFLFLNKRTTALDANQLPTPHVKVVMTFAQREGCEAGEPFAVNAAKPPTLVCGKADSGKDDRTTVKVPLEVSGTTWTVLLPLATDDNVSSCTLRLHLARSVAAGGKELRFCFDVTADGAQAADPIIIIRDGGD
jgi:hypothetical protein